jgi:hypothetical protein
MSQANSKTKRRLALAMGCVAVLIVTALFTLWYFPGLTFRMVSVADGPNNWSQRWQTILFISVTENLVSYPSEDEARHAFENEIARAETIVERTKQPAGLPYVDEQVVGTFILSTGRQYSILRLQKKDVYQTYAPSLRYALAFDKFRDRNR